MDIEKLKVKKSIQELLEFGIINIDKPSGPTSFNISDFVRKALKDFGIRKTSHFGTLDPKVTGVLPIALNRACKLTGFFLGEDKEYVGIMRIHEDTPMEKIKETIREKFIGRIMQMPPVKSRVKRQFREREIKKFELLEKSEDGKDILFHVECEGGTYIRKLIDDLGKELGIGAHMLELRRIRAGIFSEYRNKNCKYPSVNLYDFEKAVEEYRKGSEKPLKDIIVPAEIVSEVYPVVRVKEKEIKRLLTGKPIFTKDLMDEGEEIEKGRIICVFSGERFIGMYKVINTYDKNRDEIFAKPEFVLQPLYNFKKNA